MRGPERLVFFGDLSNQICFIPFIKGKEKDSTISLALWVPNMPLEKNGCTVYFYCVCTVRTIQGCKVGPSGLGSGHRSGVYTFTYRYVLIPEELIFDSRLYLILEDIGTCTCISFVLWIKISLLEIILPFQPELHWHGRIWPGWLLTEL